MNILEERVAASKRNVIRDDRRARIAKAFFMVAVVGALAALLIITILTLDRVETQVRQQQQVVGQLKTLLEQQSASTAELKKDMACIAKFFAQRDRSSAVIEDSDKCSIIRTSLESGQTSPQDSPVALDAQPSVAATPQPQGTPQPSTQPRQPSDPELTPPPPQPDPAPPTPQPSLVGRLIEGIRDILGL